MLWYEKTIKKHGLKKYRHHNGTIIILIEQLLRWQLQEERYE